MLLAAVAAVVIVAFPLSAAAANDVVTDIFEARATTGVGSPTPVDIDPARMTQRADGAIGLAYTYRASGEAYGGLSGALTYEEHGYIFFQNPAVPSTFAGSRYDTAAFTIRPHGFGARQVVITDTNPAAYHTEVHTVPTTRLGPLMATYGDMLLHRLGITSRDGALAFGTFTFSTSEGTFTGVSTPDSRHFVIRVRFPVSGHQVDDFRDGAHANDDHGERPSNH